MLALNNCLAQHIDLSICSVEQDLTIHKTAYAIEDKTKRKNTPITIYLPEVLQLVNYYEPSTVLSGYVALKISDLN